MMEVFVERCCGIDVHKAVVVACVLIGEAGKKPQKQIRRFSTFTKDLMALREWLVSLGVTVVGMESTGSYWKPVYAVLEEEPSLELIVGNAQHMQNVPGRKTDVIDSEWIAFLVRMGLVRKSYVPPPDLRDLRDLLRYRRSTVQSRSAERNRLQKLLETANLKLGNVASDVFGKSGMAMLRALADGETNPERLADLAQGLLRKKLDELRLALDGRIRDHHRFILKLHLQKLDELDQHVQKLDQEIDRRLEPYREQIERLSEIPGVKDTVAATIVAEIGVRMEVFPSAGHLAAWAGVCPGNNESAGKNLGTSSRKGNEPLRTVLVEAANAARNKKDSYLRDKFFRLKARIGMQHAKVAIAHKILVAAYQILKTGQRYKELGDAYLDRLDQQRVKTNLVRRLERLGYSVALEKKAA
jgi:transposase